MTINSNRLTAAQVVAVFQQYPITDNSFNFRNPEAFKLQDWENITKLLLEQFTDNIEVEIHPHIIEPFTGGFVEINDRYINCWSSNISKLTFPFCYPHIIANDIKNGEVNFNYHGFGEVYVWIVENKVILKRYCIINNTEETYNVIRCFINFLYGIMASNKPCLIKSDYDISLVSNEMRNVVMNIIYDKFRENIPYIDTDEVYFHNIEEIKEEVIEFVNQFTHLPYEIEHGIEGTFIARKKFVIMDNGVLKRRGLIDANKRRKNKGRI